jgi:lipopolysaccharide transport system ATP-binding protein
MEFQGKAVSKMQEITRNTGNTVLFVSHNMNAIKSLCHNGILLKNGKITCTGNIEKVTNEYILENENNVALNLDTEGKRDGNGIVRFTDFYVTDLLGNKLSDVLTGSNVVFNFIVKAEKKSKVDLGFSLFSLDGQMLSNLFSSYQNYFAYVEQGQSTITCEINNFPFCSEKAIIRGMIYVNNVLSDWPKSHLGLIRIEKSDFYGTGKNSSPNIQFLFKGKWNIR